MACRPAGAKTNIGANAGMLLVFFWPLGIYFSEISIEIYIFSFKKTHLKMSLENWQTFGLGPNAFSQMIAVAVIAFCWLYPITNKVYHILLMFICITQTQRVNILMPGQDGRHFPDGIFIYIFSNENAWILVSISLRFVPKGPINNIPSSIQTMVWRRSGDTPLSGAKMALFNDVHMRHWRSMR